MIDDERGTLAGCRCDGFIMIALTIVMFRPQLGFLIVGLIRTFNYKSKKSSQSINSCELSLSDLLGMYAGF